MTLTEQLPYLKFSVRKNDPKSQQHSLDALQWGLIPYWAKTCDPKVALFFLSIANTLIRPSCGNKRSGDGACEALHRSRINVKSQYPPALLHLRHQRLSDIIASIAFSICSRQLVTKRRNGCCRGMLKNWQPDRADQHHLNLGTILAGFPYILLRQERYRQNYQTSWERAIIGI
jgi:hypothetical protein